MTGQLRNAYVIKSYPKCKILPTFKRNKLNSPWFAYTCMSLCVCIGVRLCLWSCAWLGRGMLMSTVMSTWRSESIVMIRGWPTCPFSGTVHFFYFWDKVSSWLSFWRANQWASGVLLSLPSQCWDYKCTPTRPTFLYLVLGIELLCSHS